MKKIIVLILLISFFIFNNISFANSNFEYEGTLEINKQEQYKIHIDGIYEKLFNKLSLTSNEVKLESLENISATIDRLMSKKNYSDTIVFMLNYLKYLAEEDIKKLNIDVVDNLFIEGNINTICNDNEHRENGECILNVGECDIDNGKGEKKWEGNYWGECNILACNKGYYNISNYCKAPGINNIEAYNFKEEKSYYKQSFTGGFDLNINTNSNGNIILDGFTIISKYERLGYSEIQYKYNMDFEGLKYSIENDKQYINNLGINIEAGEDKKIDFLIYSDLQTGSNVTFTLKDFSFKDKEGNNILNDFETEISYKMLENSIYDISVDFVDNMEIIHESPYNSVINESDDKYYGNKIGNIMTLSFNSDIDGKISGSQTFDIYGFDDKLSCSSPTFSINNGKFFFYGNIGSYNHKYDINKGFNKYLFDNVSCIYKDKSYIGEFDLDFNINHFTVEELGTDGRYHLNYNGTNKLILENSPFSTNIKICNNKTECN
ncbi:MAG: hypothetical protein QM490_01410 [Candidatus Gracilibacteria bacterium]